MLKNPAYARPGLHGPDVLPIGLGVGTIIAKFVPIAGYFADLVIYGAVVAGLLAAFLAYRLRNAVLDDMVVNMVDVGEETGELDTMLYKVADNFDEEVAVLTESLTALMEPLLIITLGGIVGFIVIALFMPLISLISNLSGGK